MTVSSVFQDYMKEGTHAARPATPAVGTNGIAIYYETDTTNTFLYDSTGAAWVQINGGGGGAGGLYGTVMTVPCKAANTGLSTQVNFTTASTNDATQGQRIIAPALGSTKLEGLSKAIGAKTTWTVLLTCNGDMGVGSGQYGAGLGFQSTAGKFETIMMFAITNTWHVYSSHWSDANTYTTTDSDSALGTGGLIWLQLHDDGTHMNYNYSFDGENFVTHRQVTKAGNPNMADYLNVLWFALAHEAVTTELLSYKDS